MGWIETIQKVIPFLKVSPLWLRIWIVFLGVQFLIVISLVVFYYRGAEPLVKIMIIRSEKFYYDKLSANDDVFHILIDNEDQDHFITDLQLSILMPGPIREAKDYFSKGSKNISIRKYPDESIPTDSGRKTVHSSKFILEVDEIAPDGIVQLRAICDASILKPVKMEGVKRLMPKQILKSEVKGMFFWKGRKNKKHISLSIQHQAFTIRELMINEGILADWSPYADFLIDFWTDDPYWLEKSQKNRVMFLDLHKEDLDIVLFRDSDYTLKLYYSSPYFRNKMIAFDGLSELDKKTKHFILLVCSSKYVSLYIDGNVVGSIK